MKSKKYIIPQISAQSIIASAKRKDNGYSFYFDTTDVSKEYLVEDTLQDDCPIFYQAMCLLGEDPDKAEFVSDKLRDVFVYIDFSGIFDRKAAGRVLYYQNIAEYMFRPEGITLNFGKEDKRYIAFERSASMSRANQLSFIRADMYEPLRERMILGMSIGKCQLSKLYAYNALLFTSGKRYKDSDTILNDKRIIVIKNPESVIEKTKTVTVNGNGSNNAVRKYTRTEENKDITITEFDGEGFISPRLADLLDEGHNSFQIRMPYIKGVVHKVDFAALLSELEVPFIVDMWGNKHNPADVDIILTNSMFKGLKWMTDNGISWAEYIERCKKYNHALYISGKDKIELQDTTELNYQFLNTLSIIDDEFRPKDLPLGWKDSPEYDSRHWITKTTETKYYHLIADNEARCRYFTDALGEDLTDNKRKFRAELISKNALFIDEPIYAKELKDKAENLLGKYAMGKLLVAGDNRYLSDDLLRLIAYMIKQSVGEGAAYHRLEQEFISGNFMYAPQPSYEKSDCYTILRSPHIARNEEVLVKPMLPGELRDKYLSHLSYVIMVDSRSLIPERLGGADFDGDMVKTLADPLVNKCVMRSSTELPLLKIPTEQPLIADATDWYERFITVKNTFSSRVGQISNAALSRGIIAYDENTADEDKERYYHEVETLAILTGLEIDSAKSGVKPDLSEYIEKKTTRRSIFLRYKSIVGSDESHKWYEPSKNARLKKYFDSIDWNTVSSNLEKLPYLAYMLERETEAVTVRPVSDEQLFTFAQTPDWKDNLDSAMLNRVAALIADYETALSRVRYIKHISTDMKRKGDIYRILFARGQEKDYTVDELYSVFDGMLPQQIRKARLMLDEAKWHLAPPEERTNILYTICGTSSLYVYLDVFCDFRNGGYRIVGDIICDFDDMYRKMGIQKSISKQKGDSKDLQALLSGITARAGYKEQIIRNCMN
ncbi:MAG: hypothetical protein U0L72_04750, partial [Acutalibacteraceae bacterium]|nr:hypothetical protein [Acutalibacteraceae bacterium]